MMRTLLGLGWLRALLLVLLMFGARVFAQTTATVTVLGGEQSSGGIWDSGDVTITINNMLSRTVSYGQFSTPSSVAAGLAALISRECYGVASAKADGAVITFRLRYATAAPISITAGTAHWDGAHFLNASFSFSAQQTVSPTQVTLVGNTGELIAPNTQIGLTANIAQNAATGSIEFYDRGVLLDTRVVSGSQASYTTPPLAVGAHELYAKYTGDGSYAGSTSNTVYATAANHTGPTVGTSVYWYTITADGTNASNGTVSGYAANGNITAYNDAVMGRWNFGYDSLNRLSSGTALSGPVPATIGANLCWTYDSFGNRLSQSSSAQPFSTHDGSLCQATGTLLTNILTTPGNDNRLTSTNASGFTFSPEYDAAGNVKNDGHNSYLYDAEGRVCAVAPSVGGMLQYIYDAEGRRVGKGTITNWSCDLGSNNFTQTAAYIDGPGGEQMTEMDVAAGVMTWKHTNVFAAGKLIATYQNDNGGTSPAAGNLHFALSDWLGTKRVQTTYDGTVENPNGVSAWVSLPFGDMPSLGVQPNGYATPDASEQHFTGKERDQESGLDYFGARYYGSSMGRWMSPDWASNPVTIPFANIYDPQSLNLYSYVGNNPMSRFDPYGHDCDSNTQDVVCAVRAAAKAVWHWLSSGGGDSGSNPQSTLVTTNQQDSFQGQLIGVIPLGQQPSLIPRSVSLNDGISGEFGVYSGMAGSAQISSTYDFKSHHSYGSITTGGFNNHNNSPNFSPDPTNWVFSAGASAGASISISNGSEAQVQGSSHTLNVLGFSYSYTGSWYNPGVYQISVPILGYGRGLFASHYNVNTTLYDANPDIYGDVYEMPD